MYEKSTAASVVNLLILGIAIILIIIALNNLQPQADPFVGKVPMVLGGGGMPGPYYVPGVFPTGQPMMYPNQYYPAKVPYYNDSTQHVGRPCQSEGGCGVLGVCQNGVCTVKSENDTVFNMKI